MAGEERAAAMNGTRKERCGPGTGDRGPYEGEAGAGGPVAIIRLRGRGLLPPPCRTRWWELWVVVVWVTTTTAEPAHSTEQLS